MRLCFAWSRSGKQILQCRGVRTAAQARGRGIDRANEHAQSRSLEYFQSLSMRDSVIAGLRSAFPHVRVPTDTQKVFIPPIIKDDTDVFIQDYTGTGKSFGLALALLSKQRRRASWEAVSTTEGKTITSIFLVPHSSLAVQIMDWIERLTPQSLAPLLPSIVQVLARGSTETLESQIQRLRTTPPHIMVATPQAVLDVFENGADVLQLQTLRTIVVDEVDYQLGFGAKSAKTPRERSFRPLHPSATMTFLRKVFEARPKFQDRLKIGGLAVGKTALQLVLASATFPPELRSFLLTQTKWLADPQSHGLVKAGFAGIDPEEAEVTEENIFSIALATGGPARALAVKHFCVIVGGDGQVRNFSRKRAQIKEKMDGRKRRLGVAKLSPTMVETIATCVALDEPKLGLVVVDSSAPVLEFVHDLRKLGINAQPLDLLGGKQRKLLRDGEEGGILLVSTRASTRGLDMPISHVYLAGLPESAWVYQHLAGRVGRRGEEGYVVQILEAGEEEEGLADEMYERLGVDVDKYKHVVG